MSELPEDPGVMLTIVGGVSIFTGEPFCGVHINGVETGTMAPSEVRMMAMFWMAAAEAAESDAAILAELRSAGLEDEVCASFLANVRKRRELI